MGIMPTNALQHRVRALAWVLALVVASLVMWIAEASQWGALTTYLVLAGALAVFVMLVVPLVGASARTRTEDPPRPEPVDEPEPRDPMQDFERSLRVTPQLGRIPPQAAARGREQLSRAEQLGRAEQLRGEVTRRDWQVFEAAVGECLTEDEVAERFGMSPGAVRATLVKLFIRDETRARADAALADAQKKLIGEAGKTVLPIASSIAGSPRAPREPWPGYADLDESERQAQLALKFDQAKEQGDQSYAYALASAVANYELALELQQDNSYAEAVAVKAGYLHEIARTWSATR
jgi:hypothetical protein